jgi:hypothetical protein
MRITQTQVRVYLDDELVFTSAMAAITGLTDVHFYPTVAGSNLSPRVGAVCFAGIAGLPGTCNGFGQFFAEDQEVAPASTVKLSHLRLLKGDRSALQATEFHNEMRSAQ